MAIYCFKLRLCDQKRDDTKRVPMSSIQQIVNRVIHLSSQ